MQEGAKQVVSMAKSVAEQIVQLSNFQTSFIEELEKKFDELMATVRLAHTSLREKA